MPMHDGSYSIMCRPETRAHCDRAADLVRKNLRFFLIVSAAAVLLRRKIKISRRSTAAAETIRKNRRFLRTNSRTLAIYRVSGLHIPTCRSRRASNYIGLTLLHPAARMFLVLQACLTPFFLIPKEDAGNVSGG